MSGVESDTFVLRAKRWAIRTGFFVASFLAVTVASLLGGLLYGNNLTERLYPGTSLLMHKVASVLGGSYVVVVLAVVLLLSSQWLRGKMVHLRQKEYDRTGERVLHDLQTNPLANVSDFYLYLRAFETTGKLNVPLYLRVRRKCIWIYQRLVTDDLESYTSLSVRKIAPLIALGRPGESIGAGRVRTDTERWQADIVTLMHRSKGILLIPSDRPGTLWEMDTLNRERLFSKVVFIMPPRTTGEYDTSARWEAARKAMAVHGLEAPQHQERGMLFRLDSDGRLATAEPLLLSSTRKVRKAFKRLFKNRRKRAIYKEIVRADKRASRAAFWGWLQNAHQLAIFPLALLGALLPAVNIGFDPAESWATVVDRFLTAREIDEFHQDLQLSDSQKYLTLAGSVPAEKHFQMKNLLVAAGLPRLESNDLLAYYGGQGEMLKRIHDSDCAAFASGEAQPERMKILRTYISSDRIQAFMRAETLAIRLAAEEAPLVTADMDSRVAGAQQFLNNLSQGDSQRYLELIQKPESLTPKDRCWLLRTQMASFEKLPPEQGALWARALAAVPENQENRSDSGDPQANQSAPVAAPNPAPSETKLEPQPVALLNRETVAKRESQAGRAAAVPPPVPYEAHKTQNAIAEPAPDLTVPMLENAHAAMNAGHFTQPSRDSALAWALQAKQRGNPQGAVLESKILKIVGNRILSDTAGKDYDAALGEINGLMVFYPDREQLISLKSKIESEQQRARQGLR